MNADEVKNSFTVTVNETLIEKYKRYFENRVQFNSNCPIEGNFEVKERNCL